MVSTCMRGGAFERGRGAVVSTCMRGGAFERGARTKSERVGRHDACVHVLLVRNQRHSEALRGTQRSTNPIGASR
mgnify:CR=1 FL=1